MSKARSELGARVSGAVILLGVLGAAAGCEALIGADFDVEAAPAGEGGGGAGTTAATTGSTSTGGEGGGGAVSSSSGAGGCPTTADTIAEGEPFAWGIAVDGTHVYWSSLGTGSVLRAPKAGGGREVVASGQIAPNRLVMAGDHVYWTDTGTEGDADGAVRFSRRDVLGDVRTVDDGLRGPIPIVTDGTSVYFTDQVGTTVGEGTYMQVRRAAIGDEASEIWTYVPTSPNTLAVGDGLLFGGSHASDTPDDPTAGTVWKVDLEAPLDNVAEAIDALAPRPVAMTFAGGVLGVSSFARERVDFYSPTEPLAPGSDGWDEPADIRHAGGWFYVAEFASGTLWRLRAGGGGRECVVTGMPSVNGLAVDGERLYFTQYRDPGGAVRSVALPP